MSSLPTNKGAKVNPDHHTPHPPTRSVRVCVFVVVCLGMCLTACVCVCVCGRRMSDVFFQKDTNRQKKTLADRAGGEGEKRRMRGGESDEERERRRGGEREKKRRRGREQEERRRKG